MSVKSRSELQSTFITGAIPTQQNFTDLLDSYLHTADGLSSDAVTNAMQTAPADKLKAALQGVCYQQTGYELIVDKGSILATDNRAEAGIHNATIPYATIQAAVTAATAGDTVIVKTGTYTEQIVIPAGRHLNIELHYATIQYNSDTDAVITCAHTSGSLCITGFGNSGIINKGLARAVHIQWAVGTNNYNYRFENIRLESAGDWAITWFTGASSSNKYIFCNVDCIGGMGFDNDQTTADHEDLFNCKIGGNLRLHASATVKLCRLKGNVMLLPAMKFDHCDFITASISYGPADGRSYILDYMPLYSTPSGANTIFLNCSFKGNSLMFLRDGGGGWLSDAVVRFSGCHFELTGPDGFSFWQYNVSAHQVVIAGCMSNMDYATGTNYSLIGGRLRIYNSSFDNAFKAFP